MRPAANPFIAGLRARCPRCGEGRLFEGFLKVSERCEACGLDFSAEDAGDGPAVFIMLIVGFIVVPPALLAEAWYTPPIWVHLMLWIPLSLALCLLMLRPFKATMFAVQYVHGAREARPDDGADPGDR